MVMVPFCVPGVTLRHSAHLDCQPECGGPGLAAERRCRTRRDVTLERGWRTSRPGQSAGDSEGERPGVAGGREREAAASVLALRLAGPGYASPLRCYEPGPSEHPQLWSG
eukprot:3256560-Rhodomonas_salina.1